MSWGMCVCVCVCVCVFFLFCFFQNPAISSVTFADCRVIGRYIFPLPPLSLSLSLSLSLWNRSFVCKELKQSGRRIQSSAGNASRAEMLLGKEVGKSQKTSPLSPSVHMTLGPERASERAGGGTAQHALVHTRRNLQGRVECGSASPSPLLKWVQINWNKTFKGQYKFDLLSAY